MPFTPAKFPVLEEEQLEETHSNKQALPPNKTLKLP